MEGQARNVLYHEGSDGWDGSVGEFKQTFVIYPKTEKIVNKTFEERITGITVGAVTQDQVSTFSFKPSWMPVSKIIKVYFL